MDICDNCLQPALHVEKHVTCVHVIAIEFVKQVFKKYINYIQKSSGHISQNINKL